MTAGAVTTSISAAAVQIYRCNIQPLLIERNEPLLTVLRHVERNPTIALPPADRLTDCRHQRPKPIALRARISRTFLLPHG